MFAKYLGRLADDETRAALAHDIFEYLHLTELHQLLAVASTLCKYSGKPLAADVCRQLIYRIVCSGDLLREGKNAADFTGTSVSMWAPFQVDYADFYIKEFGAKKRTMVRLSLIVIDGVAAGATLTKLMPSGYAFTFSKALGFNRRYPYEKPAHLVDLQFAGLIEPSGIDDLQFSKYAMTASMKKRNKGIIHSRIEPTTGGGRPLAEV